MNGVTPDTPLDNIAQCQRRAIIVEYTRHVCAHRISSIGHVWWTLDRILREDCSMFGEVHKTANISGEYCIPHTG